MKRLKSVARFLGMSFVVNAQSVFEYRVNFLVQFFGMILNNAAFAAFWAVLIDRTGGIGGYQFPDVMFIWAMTSGSFGLAHILFGNIRSLGEIIVKGDLDSYLLQPRDAWLNVLASRTIVSAWGDFAYGFIVLAFLPDVGPARVALFCAAIVTGALIVAAAFSAAECLAFFVGNASALSSAFTEFVLSFSLYPDTIFDKEIRWLFYTLVPSAFISFIPLAAWRSAKWGLVPVLALAAVAYVAASYGLFRLGLRRYESGNQIGSRI